MRYLYLDGMCILCVNPQLDKTGLVYFLDLNVTLISSKSRNLMGGKMTFTVQTSFDSFCSDWFHSDYDTIYQQIQLLPIEQRRIDKTE